MQHCYDTGKLTDLSDMRGGLLLRVMKVRKKIILNCYLNCTRSQCKDSVIGQKQNHHVRQHSCHVPTAFMQSNVTKIQQQVTTENSLKISDFFLFFPPTWSISMFYKTKSESWESSCLSNNFFNFKKISVHGKRHVITWSNGCTVHWT